MKAYSNTIQLSLLLALLICNLSFWACVASPEIGTAYQTDGPCAVPKLPGGPLFDTVFRPAEYAQAARNEPSRRWFAYYKIGYESQADGNYRRAIDYYMDAYKLVPNKDKRLASISCYALGTAYDNAGDLERAINCDKVALVIGKGRGWQDTLKNAQARLAYPFLEEGYKKQTSKDTYGNYDNEGAIKAYEEALKIDEDPVTRLNLGTAYQAQGNLEKARENYGKTLPEGVKAELYAITLNAKLLDASAIDALYYLGTTYDTSPTQLIAIGHYKLFLQLASAQSENFEPCKGRLKQLNAVP